jgi:hypothetical protein
VFQMNGETLRQGDVSSVALTPIWHLSECDYQAKGDGSPHSVVIRGWNKPLTHLGRRVVLVCSHDCDLENPRSRTAIALAPVIRVPAQRESQLYRDIMSSARSTEDEAGNVIFDWINFFPLELPDLGDHVADLSALISVAPPADAVSLLVQHKLWEMTDETQRLLGRKLSAFFLREQAARPEPPVLGAATEFEGN